MVWFLRFGPISDAKPSLCSMYPTSTRASLSRSMAKPAPAKKRSAKIEYTFEVEEKLKAGLQRKTISNLYKVAVSKSEDDFR
jgi:Fe-S-cluster containining protein